MMTQPAFHTPLYDRIGTHYDVTSRADPLLVARLIEHLHPELHPEPARMYLDIACGTGNYTVAVAQTGMRVHGIDQASRVAVIINVKRFLEGDACPPTNKQG